jgi:hypothetical protein
MVVLKSNLEYSFDTIINDFEQIIGQELTQEYLMSSKYDSLGVQNNGINIHFIEVDGVYIPYYTLRLNDKIYVLNK